MALMDEVKKIIAEQLNLRDDKGNLDVSQVTPDAHFIDDLGADSLDTVELVLSFEEAFDISIPDEDAEKLETVGKAVEYLKAHVENE